MKPGAASEARATFRPDGSVDHTPSVELGRDQPLKLASGAELGPFTIAYQTYGTLNEARSNAILLCHALTGDQYAAGIHPVTGRPGWWDDIIGPGLPFDTDRYFVVCSNVLGGCMGTTGPVDVNPSAGKPYDMAFPLITISDMVAAQARLLDHLGIDKLLAVIGGSMGAMQALEWAHRYPHRVFASVPIAGSARTHGAKHRISRGRPPGDHV